MRLQLGISRLLMIHYNDGQSTTGPSSQRLLQGEPRSGCVPYSRRCCLTVQHAPHERTCEDPQSGRSMPQSTRYLTMSNVLQIAPSHSAMLAVHIHAPDNHASYPPPTSPLTMYTTPAVVLAVLGSALALPQFMPRDAAPDFTDADLLASCPGGPGTTKLERADKCTLEDPVTIPNVRKFTVVGNPQLNCDGGSDAISVQLGGQTTITQTTTVSADVGFEVDELKIGGGVETSSSTSSTVSRQVTYNIPPKRQAVFVAGQNYQAQSAHVQVNYADRQFGHFIWFTNENVTHLTAIQGDIEFDVHESACGTDPTDLSSINK